MLYAILHVLIYFYQGIPHIFYNGKKLTNTGFFGKRYENYTWNTQWDKQGSAWGIAGGVFKEHQHKTITFLQLSKTQGAAFLHRLAHKPVWSLVCWLVSVLGVCEEAPHLGYLTNWHWYQIECPTQLVKYTECGAWESESGCAQRGHRSGRKGKEKKEEEDWQDNPSVSVNAFLWQFQLSC